MSENSIMYNDYERIRDCDLKYEKLKKPDETTEPKVYKARFLMMFLFCMCTMLNGFQWIQFANLASVLSCYYDVSIETINWTSIVFMAMFLPFTFPVMWMMQTKGLRLVLVIAAAGNTLSACVQCFSLPPNRFGVALLSQTMASIAQSFSYSVSPVIPALWFGSNEVSTAGAIGVFCNNLGVALSFIVGPLLIPSDCNDVKDVRQGLSNLAVGQAVINALVFLAIIIFFKDKPPTPPSFAEANKPAETELLLVSIKKLFKNLHFSLFIITYGIINGIYAAIGTMLNQIVVKKFPGKELEAGQIGMISIFSGMTGCVVFGFILDKTHRYRFASMGIYSISLLGMVIYTVIANIRILWLYYVMFSLLGFFMLAYLSVGYQFGIELSYPVHEGTSATILAASGQLAGIFATLIGSWLEQSVSDVASNLFFCILIFVGLFISVFIKCEDKRTNLCVGQTCLKPAV